MQKFATVVVSLLLISSPAMAQQAFVQPPAYKECTDLATRDPQAALRKADEWLKIDDGFAAHHCRAMALFGLSQFPQAAEALLVVRDKITPDNIALRTYVARQAAKAWVNAGRTDAALSLLTQQINEMSVGKYDNATEAKLSAELLLDRAKLRRKYGQTTEAVQDLWRAVRVVVVANIVMSLDNVIAVAAAAKGNYLLLGLGLAVSIPVVIAGSALFLAIIERFPIVIWGGGALLGWIAGGLLPDDPIVAQFVPAEHADAIEIACGVAGAIIVVTAGLYLVRSHRLREVQEDI
jgi:predicted tellurium resistance membrane protein TerC